VHTMTGAKSTTFCSRSCASKGSMSEERREAQRRGGLEQVGNLISASETLRRREAWKYERLGKFLVLMGEDHVFEHPVGNYVFDLALPDRRTLVEFDGSYHWGPGQQGLDGTKDAVAKEAGWVVVRVETTTNQVIEPDVLYFLFEDVSSKERR